VTFYKSQAQKQEIILSFGPARSWFWAIRQACLVTDFSLDLKSVTMEDQLPKIGHTHWRTFRLNLKLVNNLYFDERYILKR